MSDPAHPIRGAYDSNLAGRAVLATTRLLSPFVQVALLRDGYAADVLGALGHWRVSNKPLVTRVGVSTATTWAGLTGYLEKPGNVLVLATTLAALKHVYWSTVTCNQPLPAHLAFSVGAYNGALDVINSLILAYNLAYHPSGAGILTNSDWKQYLGLALVVLGAVLEVLPEEHRRAFKRRKENKGKILDTGAFAVVRHPNYLGYALWRVGLALTTGSSVWAGLTAAFQLGWFAKLSIPEISAYMRKRYGAEYEAYEKKVPYKLIPYIY